MSENRHANGTANMAWSSHIGFLLACVGAAIGLGNIWKFPYMAGTQGGGAFVLIYLVTIFLIAIPVAAAELVTGRMARRNAVDSVIYLARDTKNPSLYGIAGLAAVLASFMLLTFYPVISGWVLAYLGKSLMGGFSGFNADQVAAEFNNLLANPAQMIFWQVSFLMLTGFVVARDIRSGLEKANLFLMPVLFLMLVMVVIYGAIEGDIGAAISFLFTPDFSSITPDVILSAVGHGFFSVGVGAAMLITYGSYLDHNISIGEAAITIGIADTIIALLAGIGIFAIVFGQALEPSQGPGLIFVTLPLAFSDMAGGSFFASLFFLLVVFAALTSNLALTEVIVRFVSDKLGTSRVKTTFGVLLASFIIGLTTIFSFNILSDFRLSDNGVFADKTLFDAKDYVTSNILMPLGGLLIVAFAGWIVPAKTSREHFGGTAWMHTIWLWLSRLIAPLGVIWVFISNL